MKIKTFNAGRVQATKISKLYIARNDSGSGFNILATVEGHHCDVILKRYLTEHKADAGSLYRPSARRHHEKDKI